MPRRDTVSVRASHPARRSVAQWPPKTAASGGSTAPALRVTPASPVGWSGHWYVVPTSPIRGPEETPTSIVGAE
jgi:hypothetical protein